jgi:ATP-dependent DNA ligase
VAAGAGIELKAHPHMLRHACGHALANKGQRVGLSSPGNLGSSSPPNRLKLQHRGTDWVHEIKHDGYRIIVRRDGPTVLLHSRNAYDWTVRLAERSRLPPSC